MFDRTMNNKIFVYLLNEYIGYVKWMVGDSFQMLLLCVCVVQGNG